MGLSKIEESSLNLLANSENVKKALNANNGAPIYACRAWVNFNGTGTVAIRASGNVSSITDNGTGDYTIKFTNAMPDTNYAVQATSSNNGGTSFISYLPDGNATQLSSVRVYSSNTTVLGDPAIFSVSIFR